MVYLARTERNRTTVTIVYAQNGEGKVATLQCHNSIVRYCQMIELEMYEIIEKTIEYV